MMLDWRQWSSHRQRWITGLLLVVPVVAVLSFGPFWTWAVVVSVFSALGLWEFQGLVFREGLPVRWQVFYISVGLLLPAATATGGAEALLHALAATLFLGFLSMLAISPRDPAGPRRIALFALGWIYIPFLLSHILLLASLEHARAWIYFVIVVIAAGDIGAYYGGRQWGAHKLYEVVSPKKTVEGALSGLASSMTAGVLFGFVFLRAVPFGKLACLSITLAVIGQLGDLFESMVKRVSGKKDSSQLLPGHGGILDRLDSMFFVFPTAWFFLKWFIYG